MPSLCHSLNFRKNLCNPLWSMILFVFSLANFNSGLTSFVTWENKHSLEPSRMKNQKFIFTPSQIMQYNFPTTIPTNLFAPNTALYITPTTSIHSQNSKYSVANYDPLSNSIRNFKAKDHIKSNGNNDHEHEENFDISSNRMKDITFLHEPTGSETSDMNASNNELGEDFMSNTPMYFGTPNSSRVLTQTGATAHIPCTVYNIGDGMVSWIRKRDHHLLTVGLATYSSDERFTTTHLKHSEDWTLQIKYVQSRDAGLYECQVTTHPPTSIFLHLNVIEARAEIIGPPVRYLTPGSTLRLLCNIVQNTEASEYIFWYHDDRMINYDIDRGINVSTRSDFQSSEVTIVGTRREHSGNYTCIASNAHPASVLIHIFKGDNPAAMYHSRAASLLELPNISNSLLMLMLLFHIYNFKLELSII